MTEKEMQEIIDGTAWERARANQAQNAALLVDRIAKAKKQWGDPHYKSWEEAADKLRGQK